MTDLLIQALILCLVFADIYLIGYFTNKKLDVKITGVQSE